MTRIVNNVTWRIGGQQGEGIDSTGAIFAKAIARQGLHIYTYRHFSSRIRGGLTFYEVRISDEPVHARANYVNYVIALGQEVIDHAHDMLTDKAVIMYDSDSFEPEIDKDVVEEKDLYLVGVPMTQLAEERGAKIAKNMVALGATAKFLDLSPKVFYDFVEERFAKKGQKIIEMNKAVIKAGYDYVEEHYPKKDNFYLEPRPLPKGERRLVVTGNEATGFGALIAGCRFTAGYPITPATEVMEWMMDHADEYGGVVVQAEDELAAINLILGAGWTGVRAMTSTSGPGFSLMTEGIGLAGQAEIPLVIVDVMRPGPSTGLPTKHSQSDLMFAVHGGHDDWPRIVVSPSTVTEAFYYIQEAFNWSEIYQCPVFFLIDQELGLQADTLDELDLDAVKLRRGKLQTEEQLAEFPDEGFKRFEFTEDGISPRSIPGLKNGLYLSSGSEHDERGIITENPENRNKMMEKRMRKLQTFRAEELERETAGHPTWGLITGPDDANVGVITWGSARGATGEALRALKAQEGPGVQRMVLNVLWPFPREQVKAFLDKHDTVFVVEANFSGQLASLIQQEVGGHDKIRRINKYDGKPFRAVEILDKINEVI